jgi:hypothetical protein
VGPNRGDPGPLERFQDQWDNTTRTLQTQRQALAETLVSERSAVLEDIAQQRAELVKETQSIRRDLVDGPLTQAAERFVMCSSTWTIWIRVRFCARNSAACEWDKMHERENCFFTLDSGGSENEVHLLRPNVA